MRYWTYMNNEVLGPFEKEKLAKLPNFTSSSLICPETQAGGEANDWKEASTYPEVSAILSLPASAPSKPQYPPAESPLALTMRGSLISAPVIPDPVAEPSSFAPELPPGASKGRGPAKLLPSEADPLAAASLKPINVLKPGVLEPPEETTKPGAAHKTPARPETILPRQEPTSQLEPLKQELEQMGAMLVSIRDSQAQLIDKLGRLEGAIMDIKALLASEPPKK